VLAAKQATTTIPIVMALGGDLVELGIVASLARPGGNVTGLSTVASNTIGKRLQLLKEAFQNISRVAIVWNPNSPAKPPEFREAQRMAPSLLLDLQSVEVRTADDFEEVFRLVSSSGADALVVLADGVTISQSARIADFALKRRLPAMYELREFTDAGGLMSYGVNRADLWRRAASYVDKILKGTKPADLPIEQPTKFDFVINLKTAQALGLTIPESVLQQATEIIQ
jgi:putative ABC transport system substrate-binding protein